MPLQVGRRSSITAFRRQSFALDSATTGFDVPNLQEEARSHTSSRRRSSIAAFRRQSFALDNTTTGFDVPIVQEDNGTTGLDGVESFENLINWANNRHETSCSQNGKPVPAASEEPGSQQRALSSRGQDFLGEKAPPLLLRIPTVGNMTSGAGPSHTNLMVLDSQASFPESLLLMAALDASNYFPEAHLGSLDVHAQSAPSSAPDQSSQKPKLLDQDAATTVATTPEAAATGMGQLHIRQKARKGLTSHFHNTVSTFKDTLLVHSPQINPLMKRILLAQAAYVNSRDESDAFHGLLSGRNPSRKPSRCESDASSHVDKEITAAAENISALPHLLKTESFKQREKNCLELPTNEFIEQRGGSLLRAIDIIPLSVIQTEDSQDRISEGEEDCIIADGTDERHASRMGVFWEQTEHSGRHNNLPASHHTRTHAHTHTHNGKRNGVFESKEQHRLSITDSNVHPHSLSLRTLPSDQRRASNVDPHSRSLQTLPSEQRRFSNVHPHSRSWRTLLSEQRGAVHTKKTLELPAPRRGAGTAILE
jgi:hypothetical protein